MGCFMRGRNSIRHVEINLGKLCNNRYLFCMTGKRDVMSFVSEDDARKALKVSERKNVNISIGGLPLCIAEKIDTSGRSMGEVNDYLNLVVSFDDKPRKGDSKKYVFLWKRRRENGIMVKGKDCKSCKYNNICEDVWKWYVDKVGFDELNQ